MRVEMREIQGKMRIKESFTPFGIFLAGVLLFGLATGFVDKAYFQRFPDAPAPVVTALQRKMVDECGVYMWVQWNVPRDPTVDKEGPYISMKDRLKQKSTTGRITIQ
jgi:hypothetical protein